MKNKFIAFVDFNNIRQAVERYYPEVDLQKARVYGNEIVDDNGNHYVLLNSREPYSLNGRKFDEVVDIDGFRHELYTLRLNPDHDKQVKKEVVGEFKEKINKYAYQMCCLEHPTTLKYGVFVQDIISVLDRIEKEQDND